MQAAARALATDDPRDLAARGHPGRGERARAAGPRPDLYVREQPRKQSRPAGGLRSHGSRRPDLHQDRGLPLPHLRASDA